MSEPTVSPLRLRRPGWIDEFRAFIMRGNVVDLAIGIIIGSAFTAIVTSLVRDIFTPAISFLSGGGRFNNIFVPLAGPRAATLAEAEKAGAVDFEHRGVHGNRDLVFHCELCRVLAGQGNVISL